MKEEGLFERFIELKNQASQFLGLDGTKVFKRLEFCDDTHLPVFGVTMDNGESQIFEGYRVQHNKSLGRIFRGGTRFSPTLNIEEVKGLAAGMTMKMGLGEIECGGAKGGVICDPKNHSLGELERISREYIGKIARYVGPFDDSLGPDYGTNSRIMSWMQHEYSKPRRGENTRGVTTGKPLVRGGIHGRENATAYGGMLILKQVLKNYLPQECLLKLSNDKLSIIVQGLGNAGLNFIKLLIDPERTVPNIKLVGVSDSSGAVYEPNGLDIPQLIEHKEKSGKIITFNRVKEKYADPSQILIKPCDILVLAAKEDAITLENAEAIQTLIILELANFPVTLKADEILLKNKIFIIPDTLASLGGVTVSNLEWEQNTCKATKYTLKQVEECLIQTVYSASSNLFKTQKRFNIPNNRLAAYVYVLEKIALAVEQRGKY